MIGVDAKTSQKVCVDVKLRRCVTEKILGGVMDIMGIV